MKKYLEQLKKNCIFAKADLAPGIPDEKVRVGLDIGAGSIKVVQMKGSAQGREVLKVGYAPLPSARDFAAPEKQNLHIAETLSNLWQENTIKGRVVRLVISDPGVYLRHIRVPRISDEELNKALTWLAEKYTPFPLAEAIVDYQTVRDKAKSDDNQMEIIIAAVERKIVEKYLSILKLANLAPSRIDISAFAAAKAVLTIYPAPAGEMSLLIDIGAQTTSIIFVVGEQLQLVRTFAMGGDQLTEVIAKGLNVDPAQAEEIKRHFVFYPETDENPQQHARVIEALEPVLSEFLSQINRSFAYCEKELIVEKVHRIFVCGGTAELSGLDQYFGKNLGVPVEKVDPFKRFSQGLPQRQSLPTGSAAVQFMAALGEAVD